MRIIFTRKIERDCTIQCQCERGLEWAVRPPSRQKGLPHDLAHYVVERELGVAWGFWGLMAHGATFDCITQAERTCGGGRRSLMGGAVGCRGLSGASERAGRNGARKTKRAG